MSLSLPLYMQSRQIYLHIVKMRCLLIQLKGSHVFETQCVLFRDTENVFSLFRSSSFGKTSVDWRKKRKEKSIILTNFCFSFIRKVFDLSSSIRSCSHVKTSETRGLRSYNSRNVWILRSVSLNKIGGSRCWII